MSIAHGNRKKPSVDSFRKGSIVHIKSKEWYDENKDSEGIIECGADSFVPEMCQFLDRDVTVTVFDNRDTVEESKFEINGSDYWFTPEMVECVVKY